MGIGSFFNEEIEKLKGKLNTNSLRTFDKTNELKEIEILVNEIPSIKQTLSDNINKLANEEAEIKNICSENDKLNVSGNKRAPFQDEISFLILHIQDLLRIL